MSVALVKNNILDLFSYMESLAKNSYARIYLTQLGLDTSNSWEATKLEMMNQLFDQNDKLKVADALPKLKRVAKALHLTNRHIIQLIQGDAKTFADIRTALDNLVITPSDYSKVFPFEHTGKMTSTGFPVLTAIEKDTNGWAVYFSTPKIKKIKVPIVVQQNGKPRTVMLDDEVIKHVYEVVYVPFNNDRIELRVSGETYKKDIEETLDRLRQAFYDVLRVSGINLTSLTIMQLEKAIVSLYKQDGYGKVVDTKFISVKNRTLMPRSNQRKTDNCLREQKYHKAGEKVEAVKCVGLIIQFKKRTTKKNLLVTTRLHLECEPNSDYNTCSHFTLENPIGNAKALYTINHLIKSNV